MKIRFSKNHVNKSKLKMFRENQQIKYTTSEEWIKRRKTSEKFEC